jgi:hypothetical protein
MKGSRCSWVTGRRGQREAQGCAAAWHAEVEELKGKKGRGSAAWRRAGGGGGWQPARHTVDGGGGRSAFAARSRGAGGARGPAVEKNEGVGPDPREIVEFSI